MARNTGEKRTAHFWTAAAYVHEGATDKAVAEIEANYALSGAEQDGGTQAGDLNLMGDILREAGRIDEALVKYGKAVEVSEAARVPAEAKAATRRNYLFEQARAAVAKHDLATAKAKAAAYATEVAARKVPFEVRQQQEIEGLIALEEKRYAAAVQAFAKANQQDPRILYLTAVALKGAGDTHARDGDGRQGRRLQSTQLQLRLRAGQGAEDGGHVALDDPCERARLAHAILSSSGQSWFIPSCGSGGTGRRASLRSLFSQESGGSNPLFRTSLRSRSPAKAVAP